jgi:hypothetical protein
MPYGFLAPRFCLFCLGPLVFLLPDFGYPKQDRQSLGARKPKGLNRIDKIWEQENQGPKQNRQNLGARKP